MRQTSLVALSVLALLLGGCQLFGGGEPEVTETTETVAPETPADPNAAAPNASPGVDAPPSEEAFSEPTVAGNPPPPPTSIPPDLIASTSSAARLQQIEGKGSDPFAPLSVTPIVQIPPAPPAPPSEAPSPSRPGANEPGAPGNPGAATSPPSSAPVAPAPPPPPPTELAKGVEVTGVVQVGSQVFAIVKAPNEPTSRYVQAGQSLANGQVLVKRIDVNSAEPIVVLEQSGVEITRIVGSPAQTASTVNMVVANLPL